MSTRCLYIILGISLTGTINMPATVLEQWACVLSNWQLEFERTNVVNHGILFAEKSKKL